jgi:predicted CXXCH cytochrome family protein
VARYNAAMDLFYEYGCLSCHRVRSRGGEIGPDITNAGSIHDAEWHFKHFKDPKSVVETSEMPNDNLSDEQAQLLTFLMMCYQGDSIPTELLSNTTQEVAQMKLPEPLDLLALEGFVGSQYCIGCHGATHPGTVKTWRDSKMASTYERIRFEPVKDNCLPCHSTGLNSETGHYAEEGIGCEACHGPGREAVRLILAGKTNEHKELIRIDRNSEPACERCHNPHVPTATHAEFYRKLPPLASQPITVTRIAEEDRSVATSPELIPVSELHELAAKLIAEKGLPSAMGQEPIPVKEPQPVITTTDQDLPKVAETEPGLPAAEDESPLVLEQESLPLTTLQLPITEPAVEKDLSALMETKPNVPAQSQPIATEQLLSSARPTINLLDVPIPQAISMPQIDFFSGAPTGRPPEKIEGGCVSSTCHSAVVLGKFVHGPTAQQDCESCHKLVDEPSHKFEISTTEPNLCFECHDPPPTTEFQHGPVALGVCTVCHNPHSGPKEFMLPETGNSLCFVCHTDMREHVHSVRIQHDVINEEGCTACHDPHRSNFKQQLKQDMSALCMECHEQVGEVVEKAVVAHEPVTKDTKCANCHEPHGGNVPELLVNQEVNLCLDCHDEPMETPSGSIINMKAWIEDNPEHHGPIREGNCTLCHQPHGSQHFRILAYEFPRKFYSPFSIEVYDLCFQCHEDTLVLDERTTALTDFRNGDMNLHYVHVNKERGRTCRACHEVHAGTKPKRMKDFVPYGTWMYPVNFELAVDGGKCAPGCHLPRGYDRKQEIIQR